MPQKLNAAGREQIALALILLKDFKCEGRFDIEISRSILELSEYLEVRDEFNKLLPITPLMKIEPRYK